MKARQPMGENDTVTIIAEEAITAFRLEKGSGRRGAIRYR